MGIDKYILVGDADLPVTLVYVGRSPVSYSPSVWDWCSSCLSVPLSVMGCVPVTGKDKAGSSVTLARNGSDHA